MDWQPIETAPKHNRQRDGSTNMPHIIAYDGSEVFEAHMHDFTWYRNGQEVHPTHWMPLPEPPCDSDGTEGEDANAASVP